MGSGIGRTRRARWNATYTPGEQPRMIESEGRQEWRISNGWMHREDGPATIWPDGREDWCLYGQNVGEERVREIMREKEEAVRDQELGERLKGVVLDVPEPLAF